MPAICYALSGLSAMRCPVLGSAICYALSGTEHAFGGTRDAHKLLGAPIQCAAFLLKEVTTT
eukprot:360936-Rhodomonas_salina.1